MDETVVPKGDEQEESSDPRIGLVIKGYEITECLGRGGMGDVYKGVHPEDGPAAIKFLRAPDPASLATFERRFEAEGKNLMGLRGTTNIATIYGINKEEPRALITEYVEGVPFSACIEDVVYWSLPAKIRLLEVVVKIAKALITVHKAGIVHRDLKPDNIMVKDPDEESLDPRLIDFGISKSDPEEGDARLTVWTSAVMGTVMTAAPEQLKGRMDVGPTADIYALGVMAFEIMNDGEPLLGNAKQLEGMTNPEALIWAVGLIENEDRTRRELDGLDNRTAKVIGPCIRAHPGDRVQSAKEAHKLLDELLFELKVEQREKREKSSAITAEVSVLDEADLMLKAQRPYPKTVQGMPTDPELATLPPPEIEEDIKPATEEEFEEADETEPIAMEKEDRRNGLILVGGSLIAVLLAFAVGIAIMVFRAPEKRAPKKHADALSKAHKVKGPKPPVMKRAVKKTPATRVKPRPVKKVTPLPKRPVVKRPVDPCAKREIPSRKCIKHHCKRDPGAKPSDMCIQMHFKKAKMECEKGDYWRHEYDNSPGRLVQCLAKYGYELKGPYFDNFDEIAVAVLFIDEIRTRFCFEAMSRNCSGRRMYNVSYKKLLWGECGGLHLRVYGKGKHWKKGYLNRFEDKMKAKKVWSWLETKPYQDRVSQVRSKWIKAQRAKSFRASFCFTKKFTKHPYTRKNRNVPLSENIP